MRTLAIVASVEVVIMTTYIVSSYDNAASMTITSGLESRQILE